MADFIPAAEEIAKLVKSGLPEPVARAVVARLRGEISERELNKILGFR